MKNPERRGLFGFLKVWKPKYIEEDIYEDVDDYEDRDVYETIIKYKTVMRDIFEERREKIQKFSVDTAVIQTGLVSRLRRSLDEGIEDALQYAEDQIGRIKEQFSEIFDEMDELIQKKYQELEQCANDQRIKEAELEKNRKLLKWIETNKEEIDQILEI